MNSEVKYVVVQTTLDSDARADELAAAIVSNRLAACVQKTAIHSTYHWKGAVEDAGEFLLTAKTRHDLAERLSEFIAAKHPYDVPEIVVLPILGGGASYLKWIDAETAQADG